MFGIRWKRIRWKHFTHALLFGSAALFSPGCAYLHGNFQTVETAQFYRSGQMHAEGLARRLDQHNINTVISLRGPEPGTAWYEDEVAVCETKGVPYINIPWTKSALPTPESLQQLLDAYREHKGPFLVHCQGGTHRSAIAAAVYRLQRGDTVDQAREEIGIFFNNAPIGELLDLYEGSDLPFERWLREVYPQVYEERKEIPEPLPD